MRKRVRFHRGAGLHRVDFGRTLAGDARTLAAEGRWRPEAAGQREQDDVNPPVDEANLEANLSVSDVNPPAGAAGTADATGEQARGTGGAGSGRAR